MKELVYYILVCIALLLLCIAVHYALISSSYALQGVEDKSDIEGPTSEVI